MYVGGLAVLRTYLLLHLLPRLIQNVAKHHAGAFLREESRFCCPLPSGSTANHRDFPIESTHASIPPAQKSPTLPTAPHTRQGYHRDMPSQPLAHYPSFSVHEFTNTLALTSDDSQWPSTTL